MVAAKTLGKWSSSLIRKSQRLLQKTWTAFWNACWNGVQGVRSVVHDVDKYFSFDQLGREVMNESMEKQTASYFDISKASDRIGGTLVSTNAFLTPVVAISLYRPGEALPAKGISRRCRKAEAADTGRNLRSGCPNVSITSYLWIFSPSWSPRKSLLKTLKPTDVSQDTAQVFTAYIDTKEVRETLFNLEHIVWVGQVTPHFGGRLPFDPKPY